MGVVWAAAFGAAYAPATRNSRGAAVLAFGVFHPPDMLWPGVSFAGSLVAVYLVNVFGPPPPIVQAIKVGGMFMGILYVRAACIDRHSVERQYAAGN